MSTNTFDIIIAGAGLSGLSLAYALAQKGYTGNVLLVDESFAPKYTKTWCFWTKHPPPFYNLIYKRWRKTFFSAADFDAFLYMNNYSYYCVRDCDYREFILTELRKYSNFHLLEEGILDFTTSPKKAIMITKNSSTYIADYIFQSIITPYKNTFQKKVSYQFYGIEIETSHTAFDPSTFTIMDIDETSTEGLGFFYVLPFKHNRALIEYILYSDKGLKKKEYQKKIYGYIKKKYGFKKREIHIHRKEKGQFHCAHHSFSPTLDTHIYNIGQAGGLIKSGTRSSFLRVHQFTDQLARSLVNGKLPNISKPFLPRHTLYDKLFFYLTSSSARASQRTFYYLFKHNRLDQVFDFLNEETTFLEEMRLLHSLPKGLLLKALAKSMSS